MTTKPQKIIFISDMHLSSTQPVARIDDAPAACFKKFRWLLKAAIQHNAVIVQAGDLFHGPRDWEALNEVTMALREYAVPFFTVYGQHDMYMRSKKARPYTAMGQLAAAGLVTILGTVPAPEPSGLDNILVRHAPIYTEALFNGHEYIDAVHTLGRLDGYRLILCGDIHRSFFVQKGPRAIFNTGPFFRREAALYNFTHVPSFAVMEVTGDEAGTIQWYEVPCEPADNVLSREHIDDVAARKVLTEFIEALHISGPMVSVNIVDRVNDALEAPEVPEPVKRLLREVMDYVG
jgi:DNA repair exonuclease SbcCD nuclease subunit